MKLSEIFFAALLVSFLGCVLFYTTYNLGIDVFYYRFNLIIYLIGIFLITLAAIFSGISHTLFKRKKLSSYTFGLVKAVSIFILGACLGFFAYTKIHPFLATLRYNIANQMLPELIYNLYEYKLIHQNYPLKLYETKSYSFIDRIKLLPLQYHSKDNYKSARVILFIDSNRIYCDLPKNEISFETDFHQKDLVSQLCKTSPRGY